MCSEMCSNHYEDHVFMGSCFFEKFRNPGTVPGTRVPSSPKVVPWDANPWDSWDWDENPWDSPGILSFGTQLPGTKNPWDWQSRSMPTPGLK